MKKIISVFMTICMVAMAVGCGTAGGVTTEVNEAATNDVVESGTEDSANQRNIVRLGGLKGPTSMGMVKLLEDDEKGLTANDYEFFMAASADELTPKLLKGELDILAVPANLGSVLYNKSEGAVRMAAVNMLGALYIVEKNGETINSLADLKGQTIYATGKGSTPEYALAFLLEKNGLDIEKDVNVEWKSEPTETVAALMAQDSALALLPQPFTTVAQTQVENLRVALDLNQEWDNLGLDSKLITAGIIVNSKFADENPGAVETFLEEYGLSTKYVKENIDESSKLIEKYDIVKAEIAKKALPQCNIVCITGNEMKMAVSGYLEVLFEENPASVGGALPGDDFFLGYE